jgi:hypothetical protein
MSGRVEPDPDKTTPAVGSSPIQTKQHGGRGGFQEGWGLSPRSAALEL